MEKSRHIDKYNPKKVWLVTHYKDGHYTVNQEICGRLLLKKNQRMRKAVILDLIS